MTTIAYIDHKTRDSAGRGGPRRRPRKRTGSRDLHVLVVPDCGTHMAPTMAPQQFTVLRNERSKCENACALTGSDINLIIDNHQSNKVSVVAPLGVKSGPQSIILRFRLRVMMTEMKSKNLKTPHKGITKDTGKSVTYNLHKKTRVIVILVLGTLVPLKR